MKIKISELKGAALVHAGRQYMPIFTSYHALCGNYEGIRAIVAAHTDGDTVEVPDELVEVRA